MMTSMLTIDYLSRSKWPKHFLEARQLDLILLLLNFSCDLGPRRTKYDFLLTIFKPTPT